MRRDGTDLSQLDEYSVNASASNDPKARITEGV
jgi:hypothetical protein